MRERNFPSGTEVISSFEEGLDSRADQLRSLRGEFKEALAIVSDVTEVNRRIEQSDRPELAVVQAVPQHGIVWPCDLRAINNFTPNMASFGVRVYETKQERWDKEPRQIWIRTEHLDDVQLGEYRLMGGRGGYDAFRKFAEEQGVEQETVHYMQSQTHTPKEAFMRMWLTVPGLTERLMRDRLDTDRSVTRRNDEEMYVAYSVMSKLVDAHDAYVAKDDGKLDHWRLCH